MFVRAAGFVMSGTTAAIYGGITVDLPQQRTAAVGFAPHNHPEGASLTEGCPRRPARVHLPDSQPPQPRRCGLGRRPAQGFEGARTTGKHAHFWSYRTNHRPALSRSKFVRVDVRSSDDSVSGTPSSVSK